MTAPTAVDDHCAAKRCGFLAGLLLAWTVWDLTLAVVAGCFPEL